MTSHTELDALVDQLRAGGLFRAMSHAAGHSTPCEISNWSSRHHHDTFNRLAFLQLEITIARLAEDLRIHQALVESEAACNRGRACRQDRRRTSPSQ